MGAIDEGLLIVTFALTVSIFTGAVVAALKTRQVSNLKELFRMA